jgi:hypothetical protein
MGAPLGKTTDTWMEQALNKCGFGRVFVEQHPELIFWVVTVARFGWCMLAPTVAFLTVCSIIRTANDVAGSSDCGLWGSWGNNKNDAAYEPGYTYYVDEAGYGCNPPYAMVFNIAIIVPVGVTFAVIIFVRSRRRFENLKAASEVALFDVALCFHINRALCHWGAKAMHYCILLLLAIGIVISIGSANNDGTWIGMEVISHTYVELILLVHSACKLLISMGTHTDKVSYNAWDEMRKNKCATLVQPMHPFASAVTRPLGKTIDESIASVFNQLAKPRDTEMPAIQNGEV